jgi:hypothetical protein
MIQDPMVTDKNSPESEEKKQEQKIVARGAKVIIPLSSAETETPKKEAPAPKAAATPAPVDPSQPEAPAEAEPEKSAKPKPAEPAEETEKPEPETEAKPEAAQAQESEQTETTEEASEDKESKPAEGSDEGGIVDAFAEQAANNKQKSAEDIEAEKRATAVSKLVEEKKYFVPIGQVTHRRRARWAIALLILIVLLGAGAAAVDAGIVDPGFDLPFNLIKE